MRSIHLALVFCLIPIAVVADDAAWDGRFGAPGLGGGPVYAVAIDGNDVYVGGAFLTADGSSANRIARWDNATWSTLGNGINNGVNGTVYAIAVSGNDVYVGGAFTAAGATTANNIARWNGSTWSALGVGVSGEVRAIAVSGSNVYVGGAFTTAGGNAALRVARWNGSAWSALGTGPSDVVHAIALSGGNVYVGGEFVAAGGAGTPHLARWNGSAWSDVGGGCNDDVYEIVVDGGNLYVAGAFTSAGLTPASRIARWNGSSWSALGSGLSSTVNDIAVDGSNVYAGGAFTTAGVIGALRVAKWDGATWSPLGSGTSDIVHAIDANAGDAYAGGLFTVAGTKASFYFGRYNPLIVAVLIQRFEARSSEFGVQLTWDIFTDEELAGFRAYRAEADGPYAPVSGGYLIPVGAGTFLDATVQPGRTYRYILAVVRADGSEIVSPAATVRTTPVDVTLEQTRPNPFNPSTTIRFTLPEAAAVNLVITDSQGSVVARLVDGQMPAGVNDVQWNGTNSNGDRVSSGVYFCRLRTGKETRTRKLVLLK